MILQFFSKEVLMGIVLFFSVFLITGFPKSFLKAQTQDCENVSSQLQEFQKSLAQEQKNNFSYVNDVGQTVFDWHRQLAPLEGQRILVPLGFFDPIHDQAQALETVSQQMQENSKQLQSELDELVTQTKKCLK